MKLPPHSDDAEFAARLEEHRPRLRRLVALRLDRRVRRRVDPSDVVQEALITAARRQAEYQRNPTLPLFLWLRQLAGERLIMLHRRHLGAKARSVTREVAFDGVAMPGVESGVLARELAGKYSSPSDAVNRAEEKAALHAALDAMEVIDREVLAMRHFEQLSTQEAALALGISVEAAKKRHVRALGRLRRQLEQMRDDT